MVIGWNSTFTRIPSPAASLRSVFMDGFPPPLSNLLIWNLSTYLKISPMRIIRAIPYVIIIFIVMFVGNMSQRVLPSTGNERRDMWIAVIVNSAMTAAIYAGMVTLSGFTIIA